jgi:hypothetical protein
MVETTKNFVEQNDTHQCPYCGEMIVGIVDSWELSQCAERNKELDFEVSPINLEESSNVND